MSLSDQVFEPGFNMSGRHLVPASAGTGKTYSIQTLYLRLILLEGLTVQQILVVTFTKQATKELREKLQKILRETLETLKGRSAKPEKRVQDMIGLSINKGISTLIVQKRLQQALLDFDLAAIYTIHGFCKRTLERFAFETGQPFDVEPLEDSKEELRQLCRDWWRQNVYQIDEDALLFYSQNGFSLQHIVELVQKKVAKPDSIFLHACSDNAEIENRLAEKVRAFIQEHPQTSIEQISWPTDGRHSEVVATLHQIQNGIRQLRLLAGEEKWYPMLRVFQATYSYSFNIPIVVPQTVSDLVKECEEFRKICETGKERGGYKSILASHFEFQGDTLFHKKLDPTTFEQVCLNLRAKIQAASADVNGLLHLFDDFNPLSTIKQSAKAQKIHNLLPTLLAYGTAGRSANASDVFSAINASLDLDKSLFVENIAVSLIDLDSAANWSAFKKDVVSTTINQFIETAAEQAAQQYRNNQSSRTTATFDDYLLNLRQALQNEEGGNGALHQALRTEFKAALIDEFQDTDPIQWGIFNDVFREDSEIPCFLVGDPKQAIYRFRNGDIETYLKATAGIGVDSRHDLDKNYRAEKRLIDGVNQIFKGHTFTVPALDDREGHTFTVPAIAYDHLDAQGKPDDEILKVNGKRDEKPLKIWLIKNQGRSKIPSKKMATARHAYELTARGICEILNDDQTLIAGKRVQPGQIAVLISKHDEAAFIAKELKNLGIPCVRQGTGNVWSTDEAKDFWMILKSILNPEDVTQLRGALCAPWIGLSNDDIVRLNSEESVPFRRGGSEVARTLADWVVFFEDLRDTWLKRGFAAMFGKLAACLNLRAAFVVQPNGIRSLTNIFHLSEQIQSAIIEGRKSPEGVLAWVQSQLDAKEHEGGESNKIRMESDDKAVKIMTVFSSKGLEFPIVFAPTLFMLKPFAQRTVFEFHGSKGQRGEEQALPLSQDKIDEEMKCLFITQDKEKGKATEDGEIDIEHRRHIYVALTRAVHRTVVIALKPNEENKTTGVLSEVLNTAKWSASDPNAYFSPDDPAQCAVEVHDGDVAVEACRFTPETFSVVDDVPKKPKVDKSYGHGSYSALAPKGHEEEAATGAMQSNSKDNDGVTAAGAPEAPLDDKAEKPQGIFAFPAGAKTGTCWHEIFEDIPFDADDAAVDEIVKDKLTAYGFLKKPEHVAKRCSVTGDMVKQVLNVALPSKNKAHGEFSLKDVAMCDRKTEWEFSFSAQAGKRTPALKAAVGKYSQYADFMKALGEWDREIPGGYLTGFVDLLFRHDGRYYIVDWKSNRRKGKQEDFNAKGVQEEMSLHGYWLQYLVYCVAVHQYLKAALPDYDYDTHFGGVYYLFLRGINGTDDGIYADRAPKALIEELSSLLGDFT